ncbi:hypothetical protein [Terrisporobacter mayombei]|uniref:Uncharacterized protein n=1 Tax=Terrisporobacter mayombei TaxID=1541 RepID=A0ABY9Q7G4_9FIRM|nr:hypothetical protein [Terrisporobacter mayombei]WMT83005.1 hypothetical protein TEMA_35030 [Terrisporobacter mayombei]
MGINLYNEKIDFIGTYDVEGEEGSHTLPEDGKLGLSGNNNVIIEGHFNKDIPINKQLIMKIDNMRV